MSLVLEELGYSVRYAGDGHSALRQIRQESPDILLSDLKMPGMSGRHLLIEVRCLFPAIKVIAMSGSFCGSEVPSSVLADAFYPKGGGIRRCCRSLGRCPKGAVVRSNISEKSASLDSTKWKQLYQIIAQSADDVKNIENAPAVSMGP